MKTIIRIQNAVISSLITAIAIMTGFYEIQGLKLVIVAVMGFFVINWLLLQAERALLRGIRNAEKGKRAGAGSAIQGIPWYKMRFCLPFKKDRDTRGIATKVQAATRYNTAQPFTRYR